MRSPSYTGVLAWLAGLLLFAPASARAQNDDRAEAMIRAALSAAPRRIAEGAAVAVPVGSGRLTRLRAGTNGFTCLPGEDPELPQRDAMCLDEQGMKWLLAFRAHELAPGNTAPGIVYMLQGTEDLSNVSGAPSMAAKPHWELLWPVDAVTTRLSTTPKEAGTWIMWAGTPFAHLMIYQVP